MSFVRANGLSFHVQELGAGPPVVMLHGLVIGNLAGWYFGAASTLAATHRVVMYDLRGHGKSERPASGYQVASQRDDLAALIDACASSPVSLVGHSFGGLLALSYAMARPEAVSRLVLVDIPLIPAKIGESLHTEGGDLGALLARLPPAMRERATSGRRRARSMLGAIEFLVEKSTLADDLLADRPITDEALAAVRCPTLAIYGDRSFYRPESERIARHVPGARLELVPGTHHVHLEQSAEVGRLIQEFLDG